MRKEYASYPVALQPYRVLALHIALKSPLHSHQICMDFSIFRIRVAHNHVLQRHSVSSLNNLFPTFRNNLLVSKRLDPVTEGR